MADASNEFAPVTVGEDQLQPWYQVVAVPALLGFSLIIFITGLDIYKASSMQTTLLAILIGSTIIFAIGTAMGMIGARTRMSSYLLVRIAFGDLGASIVNLAFAVSLIGWFGVQINVFNEGVLYLSNDMFESTPSVLVLSIVASILMTATCLLGFKAISWLSLALSPIMVLATAYMIYAILTTAPVGEMMTRETAETLSLRSGVSAIVGTIIVGAIILPDITRFVRKWTGVFNVVFIAYFVIQILVLATGAFGGAATNAGPDTDILDVMLTLGLGLGAFGIVIAGAWVLNALNLYGAVLSIKATFPKLNQLILTIALGAIGVIAALLNILDYFITFLIYLSVIFTPVAGVIMADYVLLNQKAYTLETLSNNSGINMTGFAAWALGGLYAGLCTGGVMTPLSGLVEIDAILISAISYYLVTRLVRGREGAHADRN